MSPKPAILFVFTSADKLLDGQATGWYLPEAAHPFYELREHFTIHSASPKGGKAPVDQSSVKMFTDDESQKFLKDPVAVALWSETKKLKDVSAKDYAAVFIPGGHGPMIDLSKDKDLEKLLEDFYNDGKIVSSVCHGPAALILAKGKDGKSILNGKQVTGFSNEEEKTTPYADTKILGFFLEDRLKELGGKYVKADENYGEKVTLDDNVLLGQNPASARPMAIRLRELLQKV